MDDRTISRNNFGPHARIHQGNLNITYEGDTTYNYSVLPSNGLSKRAGEDDILRRLYTSPYEDRKDRNPPRVPGTCEWFTSHALFKEWQESKSSRLLWVSADPGCGKSVLVKHLVDSVLQTTESRTVCYFFFKDDFPDQRNVISALCCILRQLFMQKPRLFSDKILHQFIAGGETFANSFSNLWKTLIQTSMNPNAGEIICIFDAIDECGDTGRSQLAQELCKLYGARNNCHLKFLLTSRPYGKIHRGFQPLEIPGLPVIHLSGESENEAKKISQEIDIFIQFKVKDIRQRLKLTKEEHDLLLQKLMQITNRTYLWVYLTLDLIMRDISIDKTRIAQATSFIPETVDEAYDKILRKSYDTDKTKKILHIIVGAVRPLNLKEMNLALVLQSSHRSSNDLDLKPEARFRQELRDICGLFITIIDSKIYLLHQTAKEFLLQDAANPKDAHEGYTWKHSLNLHESHLILSNTCIWYLILLEDDENHRNETETVRLQAEDNIFLDYSARYWATHFRELHTKMQEEKTELILKICDIESILCRMWFKIYWESTNTKFPDGFTNLMIASYFGLPTVVRNLLEGDIDLNSQDSTYQRSALSWAARNGFNVIAKLLIRGAPRFKLKPIKPLLRKRAEVDLADAYGRTPLSYAVWSGNTDMVRLLIQASAQVHLKDELGATPLSYAILNQKEQITEILLQKGDQADVEDDLNNLLFSAVIKRREEEVEQLLKSSKVNPNTKDQTNWTPLLYTAQYGDAAIATLKALLEKGADPNCKDNNGQTPLLHAARFGDVATSKALLEHGADPNCKDNDHLTALLYAAMDGNVEITKALLEKGADPNCKYKFDWTPLIYAAEKAHVETVKVLLEKGADPNCKSKLGWTPLIYAATNGDVEILKALLENGADPNHTNNFNQTPLSCATKHHHKAAVKALLEGGAESSHGS